MKATYKEKVVKPPNTAQLTKIATELGYDLGQDEILEYKGKYRQIRQKQPFLISNAHNVMDYGLRTRVQRIEYKG